jgi:hypothetical protein
MSSSGAITGTPTASGTYSFVAQVADATSSTASRTYSLTVAAPTTTTPSADIVFRTGFEPGDPAWDYVWTPTDVTITSTPPPGRSGNALQIHYTICGASDGTCGSSSQDKNRWVSKVISPGLNHIFMRGSVYFKSPENGIQGLGAQRKLIWLGDEASASSSGGTWDIILSSWESSGGVAPSTLRLAVQGQGASCYGSQFVDWMNGVPALNWDTWYDLQIEVQTNTPSATGPYNGIVRVWVNGTQVLNRTDFKVNGACTTPVSVVSFGRQSNRYNYQTIDEFRFWDNIAVGTSYIP